MKDLLKQLAKNIGTTETSIHEELQPVSNSEESGLPDEGSSKSQVSSS